MPTGEIYTAIVTALLVLRKCVQIRRDRDIKILQKEKNQTIDTWQMQT